MSFSLYVRPVSFYRFQDILILVKSLCVEMTPQGHRMSSPMLPDAR